MSEIKFYKKINNIKRTIPVMIKAKWNEYLKTKSMDINDLVSILEPILMEHEVLAFHYMEHGEFVTKIVCENTGESIQSSIPISNKDPQKVMAEMTYYRRGNYTNLFDLQAYNDDDGNLSSGNAILAETARALGKVRDIKKYLSPLGVETIKQITEEQGKQIVLQYEIDSFDSIKFMSKIKSKLNESDLIEVEKSILKMKKIISHELDEGNEDKSDKLVAYGQHLEGIANELRKNKSN